MTIMKDNKTEYKGASIPEPCYPCRFDDCSGIVIYPAERLFYWGGKLASKNLGITDWGSKLRYKPGFYCQICLTAVGLISIPNKRTVTLKQVLEARSTFSVAAIKPLEEVSI